MYCKGSNPNCNGNRRDTVALKVIKSVNFKTFKIRTCCQYIGCFTSEKT